MHSHAGQYESILEVPAEHVPEAVAQVRASGATEALLAYRAERGLEGPGAPPAVVIQQMIAPDVAGVAFTADPATGLRTILVVSGIAGLADRLVAGEVDGTSWWVRRDGLTIARTEGEAILDPAVVAEIATLALRIESEAGCPQDIEWAWAGGRLHLLQARAITSPLRPLAVADATVTVFDNSNIVESYPGLVVPLTYSFASYAYARVYTSFLSVLGVPDRTLAANRAVFENMLARVDGRVFYNLGNWYRALALLPGYGLNARYMETMMGVGAPLPEPLAREIAGAPLKGWQRWREYLRLARVGFGLAREAWRLQRTGVAFRGRLDRALAATTHTKLRAMPLSVGARRRISLHRRRSARSLGRSDRQRLSLHDRFRRVAKVARTVVRARGPRGSQRHADRSRRHNLGATAQADPCDERRRARSCRYNRDARGR